MHNPLPLAIWAMFDHCYQSYLQMSLHKLYILYMYINKH